jgi:uncharacterized protein YuzB (UPF0349 family)
MAEALRNIYKNDKGKADVVLEIINCYCKVHITLVSLTLFAMSNGYDIDSSKIPEQVADTIYAISEKIDVKKAKEAEEQAKKEAEEQAIAEAKEQKHQKALIDQLMA